MKYSSSESGQTVILLLLVMVIGLTIGLSVVTRSVLDVKLSSQSEESSRAFNAAEAGIEKALTLSDADWQSNPQGIQGNVGPDESLSHYSCTRAGQAANQTNYAFPYSVEKDKVAQLYLADVSNLDQKSFSGTQMRILWGNLGTSTANAPALEISLVFKDTADDSYSVAKFALDPNNSRTPPNNFCTPSVCQETRISTFTTNNPETISTPDTTVRFQFGATLNVSDFNTGTKFLQIGRFRLLYNDNTPHVLGVKSTDSPAQIFPSQGFVVDCLGSRDETNTQRRVKVFENYPSLPDVFDYVLYNGDPSKTLGH